MLEQNTISVKTFGNKLEDWCWNGFTEQEFTKKAIGIGSAHFPFACFTILDMVALASANPLLRSHPNLVGFHSFASPFLSACRRGASNGSLMRTAILGLPNFPEPKLVAQQTLSFSRVTHGDPRTDSACVAQTAMIGYILRNASEQLDAENVLAIGREAAKQQLRKSLDEMAENLQRLKAGMETVQEDPSFVTQFGEIWDCYEVN